MQNSFLSACSEIRSEALKLRFPFFAALAAGFAAHGYAFFNKLLNHDEIESLFGKGATVTSGRWGLELVKVLFPDWSMPWIYGLISLLLMAAACCLMLWMLEVNGKGWQMLLAALVITFPALTGNFCFMFTSAPYAWAFFLAVLSAALFYRGGLKNTGFSIVLLVLALGIYQAYIAVAASLFVLVMIRETLDADKSLKSIILDGIKALVFMAAAIAAYYLITLLVFACTGTEFNSYVTENVNAQVSLLRRVRMAYDNFFYVFSFRNFRLISSETSRYLHIILAVLTLSGMAAIILRRHSAIYAAFLLGLTALLPLSICCMFLIMSEGSIHTLVLYSFVLLYFLTALTAERLRGLWGRRTGALTGLLLSAVVMSNVYFANMVYLKMQLQYENASAFYAVMTARLTRTEGFDENTRLAFVGEQHTMLYSFPELDTELLQGPSRDLVNIYSRENFLRYYLGFDVPFADEAECDALKDSPEVAAMAVYPYDGSVRKIGKLMVIKLG